MRPTCGRSDLLSDYDRQQPENHGHSVIVCEALSCHVYARRLPFPALAVFLCTGNYYCSRFAEELFNHQAERASLPWIAQSRGLALERGANNVGPIAPVVLHTLKELTISARGADRFPRQCTANDLANADFVVAVKEAEHRPLMQERFGEWEHRLDYWSIHDIELRRLKP